MTLGPIRRHRGLVDDVLGGLVTFVIEMVIVAGLGLAGLVVALIVQALI